MIDEKYYIELHEGDEFRFNRARKVNVIDHIFELDGKKHYVVHAVDDKYKQLSIESENRMNGVYLNYGNNWDGIIEVNGKKVRAKDGLPLWGERYATRTVPLDEGYIILDGHPLQDEK